MNFTKYIDNRFQELKVEETNIQAVDMDAFPIRQDAEMKALHMVLTFYRWIMKWCLVPKIIFGFILVSFGLRSPPTSPLLDKLRADRETLEKR